MFRGESRINLDAKGRMAIPAKYRDGLVESCQGRLIATVDPTDNLLFVYPLPRWEEIEEKIGALPSFNPKTRQIQQLLIGRAAELDMDANGRVLLPQSLREYAGLEKHVVLVGQRTKFELWDEATWQTRNEQWLAEARSGTDQPDELLSLVL